MAHTAIVPSTKARVNGIAVGSHAHRAWISTMTRIRNMSMISVEAKTTKTPKIQK